MKSQYPARRLVLILALALVLAAPASRGGAVRHRSGVADAPGPVEHLLQQRPGVHVVGVAEALGLVRHARRCARRSTVDGGFAYVADEYGDALRVDRCRSTPSAPAPRGAYGRTGRGNGARRGRRRRLRRLLGGRNGLDPVDVGDPDAPRRPSGTLWTRRLGHGRQGRRPVRLRRRLTTRGFYVDRRQRPHATCIRGRVLCRAERPRRRRRRRLRLRRLGRATASWTSTSPIHTSPDPGRDVRPAKAGTRSRSCVVGRSRLRDGER